MIWERGRSKLRESRRLRRREARQEGRVTIAPRETSRKISCS